MSILLAVSNEFFQPPVVLFWSSICFLNSDISLFSRISSSSTSFCFVGLIFIFLFSMLAAVWALCFLWHVWVNSWSPSNLTKTHLFSTYNFNLRSKWGVLCISLYTDDKVIGRGREVESSTGVMCPLCWGTWTLFKEFLVCSALRRVQTSYLRIYPILNILYP